MFGFRNPGLMRIPIETALKGGEPDCRNRNLHKMFRLVGLGEEAGSGIPKIAESWHSQNWVLPKLYESVTPYNQTMLELRMIDLFPSNVINSLRAQLGDTFDQLGYEERTALALAATEGTVSHSRLRTLSTAHPADITRMLQRLTQQSILNSNGNGRATVYYLKGQTMLMPEAVFGSSPLELSSSPLEPSSSVLTLLRDEQGRLLTDKLPLPVIDDLGKLSPSLRGHLEKLAKEPREKGRLPRESLKAVIKTVCQGHYFTLQALAGLLRRKPIALRNKYLAPMVRSGALRLAFAATPTHERQAYTAAKTAGENANSA